MPFLDNCPLSPEFGICKICYFRKLFLFKKKVGHVSLVEKQLIFHVMIHSYRVTVFMY